MTSAEGTTNIERGTRLVAYRSPCTGIYFISSAPPGLEFARHLQFDGRRAQLVANAARAPAPTVSSAVLEGSGICGDEENDGTLVVVPLMTEAKVSRKVVEPV